MNNNNLVAHCGLYCGACGVYLATLSGGEALEQLASRFGLSPEEMRCQGCRSDVLTEYCRKCDFRDCTRAKGIENCEDCAEWPCEKLKNFQSQMPHRAELFESSEFRKENGLGEWFAKMEKDYSCSACGAINAAYYVKCKQCGNMPGNDFIGRNIEWIENFTKNR